MSDLTEKDVELLRNSLDSRNVPTGNYLTIYANASYNLIGLLGDCVKATEEQKRTMLALYIGIVISHSTNKKELVTKIRSICDILENTDAPV